MDLTGWLGKGIPLRCGHDVLARRYTFISGVGMPTWKLVDDINDGVRDTLKRSTVCLMIEIL